MDNETRADARVVKTVRRLRSTKTNKAQPGTMTAKNNENHNIINQKRHLNSNGSTEDLSMLRRSKTKIVSSDSRSAKTTNDTLITNNPKNIKLNTKESLSKISIDGGVSKPPTSNTQKKTYQPYNYQNLKRLMKNRTEYQKNILSSTNINKYKNECINMIHNDKELKSMLMKFNLVTDSHYDGSLENVMFSQKHFLFRLEMLILNDIQESNTLKVFSTNKKRQPIKVQKENFYKEEIRRYFMKKIYDDNYSNKLNNLLININKHIENLNKFEL